MADLEDINQFVTHTEIDWELLFQPSEWYITPTIIAENSKSLLATIGFSLFCALVFFIARSKGIHKKGFWGEMRFSKFRFPDSTLLLLWYLFYIPLAIGAWLIYIEQENKWSRALTIYILHMIVNVVFSISLWWIQDVSLALLNLLVLIGIAMFTTSQFGKVLYFASYINTPYLLFLLIYFLEFCYFWYLNEGQELMDIASLQAAKSVSVAQSQQSTSNGKPSILPSTVPKKRKTGPPDHIKQILQQRLKKQKEDDQE